MVVFRGRDSSTKAGRVSCIQLLPKHNAWYVVDLQQMTAELKKESKEREALFLELSLKRWAVALKMLFSGVLAARVWSPNSG